MNKEDLENIRKDLCKNVYKVYNVFKEFFGEERTDLQNIISLEDLNTKLEENKSFEAAKRGLYLNSPFILVYYPRVTITNENDQSTLLRDLYAKVTVQYCTGKITSFHLNRATYTEQEFLADYMHSHCPGIPRANFDTFMNPCLGTGPIKRTIEKLNNDLLNIDVVHLFCLELDMYIKTESLDGGPYRKLERIGKDLQQRPTPHFINYERRPLTENEEKVFKSFLKYLFKNNVLKCQYKDNAYSIGMSACKWALTISKSFIDWFNSEAKYDSELADIILCKYAFLHYYKTDGYYLYEDTTIDIQQYIGKKMCTFKGKDVNINIINVTEHADKIAMLTKNYINYITTKILLILNYKYGKNNSSDEEVRYI